MTKVSGFSDSSAYTPNSSRIVSVDACTEPVPLDRTTYFATRVESARDYGLVKVRTADGAEGIRFCCAGSKGGGLVTKAVRELFAPLQIGQDPFRVEGLWEKMYGEAVLQGRAGSTMRALSIIDNALWGRSARSAGLPLHKLLASHAEDGVDAYSSGGYYLDRKTPEKLGQEHASISPNPKSKNTQSINGHYEK